MTDASGAGEAEARIEFALHMQDMRLTRHMTQEELAMRVGISRPQVANIEAGRGSTSAYRALCIARALDGPSDGEIGMETTLGRLNRIERQLRAALAPAAGEGVADGD